MYDIISTIIHTHTYVSIEKLSFNSEFKSEYLFWEEFQIMIINIDFNFLQEKLVSGNGEIPLKINNFLKV